MPSLRRPLAQPGPDPIDIFVAARVRVRRLKLRMSQATLGAQIGVSFQQVQKYEEARNRISTSTLVRIADALMVAPADLLPDSPRVQPDDEYVGLFARDAANRPLVASWAKLKEGQRQDVLNLVLGLVQKNAGVRRRPPSSL